jgi:hypothetical protein
MLGASRATSQPSRKSAPKSKRSAAASVSASPSAKQSAVTGSSIGQRGAWWRAFGSPSQLNITMWRSRLRSTASSFVSPSSWLSASR